MALPFLIISILLFFLLFFGIGFILNMLFRSSWLMVVIFPLVVVYIVNGEKLIQYFRTPGKVFGQLGSKFAGLAAADITILASGLAGAVAAGIVIKLLRRQGYQMF